MRVHAGATAFVALCLAGATASVALAVREVVRTPPVVTTVAHTSRAGPVTTVGVDVRNTTGRARCVDVRVSARDSGGRDLAAATAATGLRLPPHGRLEVVARVRLTPRQYAEQLHGFFPSTRACTGRESGPGSL